MTGGRAATTAADTSSFSGRQIEIRYGSQRAVVVEVGAGLREYEVDGQPVLDGYPPEAMCDGGRGQALLPWPNRLADGHYTFDGQQHQLPVDELARNNATHGLTRWVNWNVAFSGLDRARLTTAIHPRPGYPFTLDLSIEYAVGPGGLTVTTTARNCGKRPLPFGAGQHPYLTVGSALVDSAVLRLPAHARLELDAERRLPTGVVLPVDGAADFDFRIPRLIGPLVLDDCFTALDRGDDGLAHVRLLDPRSGREVLMWMDATYRYVQVFSGDTLPAARRRRGLAIEPMTCPPDAFRSGTDLIVLQPDETRSLAWGLVVSPSS